MAKKIFLMFSLAIFFINPSSAQIMSLSQIFHTGQILLDKDGDGLNEEIELSLIIPDNPTAVEACLAAEIAARVNLESLALDFNLIKRASEIKNLSLLHNPVLIGTNLDLSQKILRKEKVDENSLKSNQGMILLFSYQNTQGIICLAGSEQALLKTGRAFFLRWPYFWEIWGRESGYTFETLENDLKNFFSEEDVNFQQTVVSRILYTFPPANLVPAGLQSLAFDSSGEISSMTVNVRFPDPVNLEKAMTALKLLAGQRSKGIRTEVLSYPACAEIEFELISGSRTHRILLERPGASRRLLTPAFKEIPRLPDKARQFDLTELFSSKGIYSDRDQDGLNDGLESAIIIPRQFPVKTLPLLTTRLVLDTAGGTFPLTYLESEVENKKALISPILVGQNSLTQELIKTGKLKLPQLSPFQGIIKTIPKALGPSEALVIFSPSPAGMEKTLEYFSKKFPYLTDYQKGQPEISWLKEDTEKFLAGENGAAEAFFQNKLSEELEKLRNQELEKLELSVFLPQPNPGFQAYLEKYVRDTLSIAETKITASSINQGLQVLEKETRLTWEADEALNLVKEQLPKVETRSRINISLGLSESPEVRSKIKKQIGAWLAEQNLAGEVEVLSAYKQGFFWITEKIISALKNKPVQKILIRAAKEKDSPGETTKRFYTDPNRWLQELYPVDEILARELNLPLERIELQMKPEGGPVYEVYVFDGQGAVIVHEGFSPRTTEIPFLSVLPEWGQVKVATGWVTVKDEARVLVDLPIKTDPERFWEFFQNEIIRPLYDFVMKKTNHEPVFSKQPYFKRLTVELWLSEPDYRLGLDEEIISSLEALHDEIYFDTLDFLRGITRFSDEDQALPADASRSSAPGNVMPVIHPSNEGQAPKIKVMLEDFQAKKPKMILTWKSPGQTPGSKSLEFTPVKAKSLRLDEIVYDSARDALDQAAIDIELEKEADYYNLVNLLDSFQNQREKKINSSAFVYPDLNDLKLRVRFQDLSLEKTIKIIQPEIKPPSAGAGEKKFIIPTDRTIGPDECLELSQALGQFSPMRSYVAGKSYEGRQIPVLEIYLPASKYVSIPRLVAFKPTLHLTARQHANEVSSTNYSLKFAELLAQDPGYTQFLKKMSVVIQPMENPDGAQLALDLSKNEPFHSLHAGRYSSPGVDIGYQVGQNQPLLPEAKVRTKINRDWLPDIYLNLHGYPSHEWIQLFSGYSPYLFRDYWIPKGWFTYYRQMNLKIYNQYRQAAEKLKKILIQEMNADPRIRESNSRFYSRYERWARRWSPFVTPLEIYDGLNVFAKRQTSAEIRLTPRTRMTFVEETPEVMDETASGNWLEFVCEQGLAYLRAHATYLCGVSYEKAVIEEEVNNRIRIEFCRSRPGFQEK